MEVGIHGKCTSVGEIKGITRLALETTYVLKIKPAVHLVSISAPNVFR